MWVYVLELETDKSVAIEMTKEEEDKYADNIGNYLSEVHNYNINNCHYMSGNDSLDIEVYNLKRRGLNEK